MWLILVHLKWMSSTNFQLIFHKFIIICLDEFLAFIICAEDSIYLAYSDFHPYLLGDSACMKELNQWFVKQLDTVYWYKLILVWYIYIYIYSYSFNHLVVHILVLGTANFFIACDVVWLYVFDLQYEHQKKNVKCCLINSANGKWRKLIS